MIIYILDPHVPRKSEVLNEVIRKQLIQTAVLKERSSKLQETN